MPPRHLGLSVSLHGPLRLTPWNGDALTLLAKDAWVKLISDLNLPLPFGTEFRQVNFAA